MTSRTNRAILGALAIASIGTLPVPALAQDGNSEARLRKLEAEVRALQRTVFPGPNGRFFQPEITESAPAQNNTQSRPSTTAVTDILARLDALEGQIQSLTEQSERNTNSLSELETRLAALEEANTAPTGQSESAGTSASQRNLSGMTGRASSPPSSPPPPPTSATNSPSPDRLAAVQAIAKPQTDDPADDEYSYGFRLWEAGFYPEAQQQLAMFVEKYPNHWRTTYGRNLLGRAFLDDGKPAEAAPWFLRNYQADKQAARAPDSLLYLAEAMIASGDTNRACIALAEFAETYPAIAAGRLSGQYEADRRKVDCN
ncbi:tetratricopeptide repeat protein [Pelagerythrobacter rhizovicinus]|uniref:Tetratricopeptide repeat protein n=1 Tax=Pelagerythrobacter rhizovicinus TaxID=2268576 RepID=A0A4Q2KGF4_9SPHN|nr:tetratricopeptide repeat protein [Pelagerythrobacter rhizovicinus]RXZ64144.1 tetratricopeptide repeat protein [Pelagerythrobacter rhizovicinus]